MIHIVLWGNSILLYSTPPCTIKGLEDDHFPLTYKCGVAKLNSAAILKIISDNKLCPTCTCMHDATFTCKKLFHNGESKVCTNGCKLNGIPVHKRACKHNDRTDSVSVSKVVSNRSIPLVENVSLGALTLGIQYDTGCQLSLISKTIPTSMYSQGTSSRIRVMSYTGEGKVILTTEIKLRINGKILKLSSIKEDLNNGSGFSFPTPSKWTCFTKSLTSSHTGQISILLGGDNHLVFPSEVERDDDQSKLTQNYLSYGSVELRTITWTEPLVSTSIKTVFIKSLSIQDLQEQLHLTVSAEKFSDPSTGEKLNQLTKEKGIQDIMNNTTVDTVNNVVSVQYLYNKNLPKFGENYYGATKRTSTLHNKIYDKPEI